MTGVDSVTFKSNNLA